MGTNDGSTKEGPGSQHGGCSEGAENTGSSATPNADGEPWTDEDMAEAQPFPMPEVPDDGEDEAEGTGRADD